MKKIIFLYSLVFIVWMLFPCESAYTYNSILPIILGVAALAGGVAKGIAAKSAHNKYAKKLDTLKVTMPEGVTAAEKIVNNMASNGLIGYNQMRSETQSTLSGSINSYKDLVDNPGALLQATQTAEQRVNEQLTNLSIQDATVKANNLLTASNFQSGVKADAERRIEDFNNSKTMAIAKERMMGTKELWGGIEQGISNGLSTYAGMSELESLNKLRSAQTTSISSGDAAGPPAFDYSSLKDIDWQKLVSNKGIGNIDKFRVGQ